MVYSNDSASVMSQKVLILTYSFPPFGVAMAPCVVKAMAALASLGYTIEVICAQHFISSIARDESLLAFAENSFSKITYLEPISHTNNPFSKSTEIFSNYLLPHFDKWMGVLSKNYPREYLSGIFHRPKSPCPFSILNDSAFKFLTHLDLQDYIVITWSPFYSVNPVMVKIKDAFPKVRWIAQFGDPWAGNPLEKRTFAKLWARWNEWKTVRNADYIVHNSEASLRLMMKKNEASIESRAITIPHSFEPKLYPQRAKHQNKKVTLRHVGVLFGHRSPEPLFAALTMLLERRHDLRNEIAVDLVGSVEPMMLESPAFRALPKGLVSFTGSVSYIESLEKMYDADILVLIEANVTRNLFMPSKLADYIGATTPILGILPSGAAHDTLKDLGAWQAHPGDINGVSKAIESVVDFVRSNRKHPWCNENVKEQFRAERVAFQYKEILEQLA